MDWIEQGKARLARKRQILFFPQDNLFEELVQKLQNQDRRIVILWAFSLAEESVQWLEQNLCGEIRPRNALEASRLWAAGEIKMPMAKRQILSCHALAKELSSPEEIALCHAVGQACSVVHTPKHAMGYPIYECTALVYRYGWEECRVPVETRVQTYLQRLQYWIEKFPDDNRNWAEFLRRKAKGGSPAIPTR